MGMKCETGRNVLNPLHSVHGSPLFFAASWSAHCQLGKGGGRREGGGTVARGHVDADAVPLDGVEGVIGGEVVDCAGDDGGELDFVVEVDAARGEDGAGGGVQEGAGGLEEEEGGAGTGVAELFDVVGVVAADAGYCVGGAEEGALGGGGVSWGAGGRGRGREGLRRPLWG